MTHKPAAPIAARPQSVSRTLANWVSSIDFNDIPGEVVAQTRQRILDITGAMLGGLQTDLVDQVSRATFSPENGTGARAVGFEGETGPASAALLMGTMGCVLEYDDSHVMTGIHASTPILAAALARGQQLRVSGRRLIESVLVGNEISCRLGVAAPGVFHRVGFHPTAVTSAFGAGYTVSRLGGLSADQIVNVAGICGSFAAGIMASWQDGTNAKSLHAGWAGASAIHAAGMAAQGVTGPEEVYEGRFGFYRSHVQDPSFVVDFAAIEQGLGSHWEVLTVAPRAYPCGHYIQPFIQATLELVDRHEILPEDVVAIDCRVADYWIPLICEPRDEKIRPTSSWHARYSVQFCIAESIFFGKFDKNALAESHLRDPAILALAERVGYAVDPAATDRHRWSGEVIVALRDGRKLAHRVDDLRGTPRNPMGESELIDKFLHNASGVIPDHVAHAFIEDIAALEDVADIRPVFAPLYGGWRK